MQTDYSQSPAVGYPGMRADTGAHNEHIVSRVNPSVAIPIGVCVTGASGGDARVKLPTTAAEVTGAEGIALADFSMEQNSASVPTHPVKSSIPVLRQGRVWVQVEEAVNKGDDVYVRWNDGTGGKTQKGAFRKSVDQVSAADTATKLPNSKYVTTAAASGYAIVEINMP